MTEQDRFLLDEFKLRIKQLMAVYQTCKADKRQLENEISGLKERLESLEQENEMLRKKYDNLKMAGALADLSGGKEQAREQIGTIMRELDKCIALINR